MQIQAFTQHCLLVLSGSLFSSPTLPRIARLQCFVAAQAHSLVSSFLLKDLDYICGRVLAFLPPSDLCPRFCSMTDAAAHVWLFHVWSWEPCVDRRRLTSHVPLIQHEGRRLGLLLSPCFGILFWLRSPSQSPTLCPRTFTGWRYDHCAAPACRTNRPPDRQHVADSGLAPQQWTFLLRWCVAP